VPSVLAAGVDAVLHAAWDLHTPVTLDAAAVMDANVQSTARLLDLARTYGVARFGLISTCAVYGDSEETAEHVPARPVSINGITKLLNERLVEEFGTVHGIEVQVYRLFNVYGGVDRFSIVSHLRRALERDAPFVLNNRGQAVRDFVHVDDVARILRTLIGMRLPYSHVNVGTGHGTTIADVVGAVRRVRPELRIVERSVAEAPYSRADTTRLTVLLGEQRFVDVMEYVERAFAPPRSS
jgi:UDP-glucose 4-epimerase